MASKKNPETTEETKVESNNADVPTNEAAAKAGTSSDQLIKVKFIKCPTGAFQLAYNEGDEAELPVELAKELVEAKFATSVIE